MGPCTRLPLGDHTCVFSGIRIVLDMFQRRKNSNAITLTCDKIRIFLITLSELQVYLACMQARCVRSLQELRCFFVSHNAHFHGQVGRSYGRVVVYCSNFERTTADALFFESLLCLARMVVAAAVAEPSLSVEVRVRWCLILCLPSNNAPRKGTKRESTNRSLENRKAEKSNSPVNSHPTMRKQRKDKQAASLHLKW